MNTRLAKAIPAAAILATALAAGAQTTHLYGVHDDDASASSYLTLLPGGSGWVTATEALGSNPADFGGKTYGTGLPAGTTVIARLNNGYFPNGTLPVQANYANFAQRVQNFVNASTGCNHWVIGNETNLAIEWPASGPSNLETITPEQYAEAFKLCYTAIKAVRPGDHVIVQAIAPWAGPYGAGTLGPYNHGPAPANNWADYMHTMLTAITTGPGAVTPDGIALHINSRGYGASAFNPQLNAATNLTLDFSWGVHKDWIQFGIPRNLWNLPLYGTECNGLYYWKGGGPEPPGTPYQTGWFQQIYADINAWNQTAKDIGLPIYRSVNMYRWANADDWSLEAEWSGTTAVWGQITTDLAAATAGNYQWPAYGGNRLNVAPVTTASPYVRVASGEITATAISEVAGFEAINAFDANMGTMWSSNETSATTPKWIVADLGRELDIHGLIIHHAQTNTVNAQSANRNTVGFWIETSTTSATGPWTLQTMVRNNTPGTNGAPTTQLVYDSLHTARYIRLYINDASAPGVTGGERGRIVEVEVWVQPPAGVGDWVMY